MATTPQKTGSRLGRGQKAGVKPARDHAREYHVIYDPARRHWQVELGHVRLAAAADTVDAAIGIAVREARTDTQAGLDAIVCVQQKDGSFHLAWSSHAP
jgi:hypothetical protein